ncbi:hypothetical protein P3T29_000012 [Kitasatospora sp. MAP5-34]|nr:hypothetical protein [Kitasatospora sp. MAP5-34]
MLISQPARAIVPRWRRTVLVLFAVGVSQAWS